MELKYEIFNVVDRTGMKLGIDFVVCKLCGFEWYRYKSKEDFFLYSESWYRKRFKPLIKDRKKSLVCPRCKKVLLGMGWFVGKCPVCGKMVRVKDSQVFSEGKTYHSECFHSKARELFSSKESEKERSCTNVLDAEG